MSLFIPIALVALIALLGIGPEDSRFFPAVIFVIAMSLATMTYEYRANQTRDLLRMLHDHEHDPEGEHKS